MIAENQGKRHLKPANFRFNSWILRPSVTSWFICRRLRLKLPKEESIHSGWQGSNSITSMTEHSTYFPPDQQSNYRHSVKCNKLLLCLSLQESWFKFKWDVSFGWLIYRKIKGYGSRGGLRKRLLLLTFRTLFVWFLSSKSESCPDETSLRYTGCSGIWCSPIFKVIRWGMQNKIHTL